MYASLSAIRVLLVILIPLPYPNGGWLYGVMVVRDCHGLWYGAWGVGVGYMADVPAGTRVGVRHHVISDRYIPINYFHLTYHI